MANDFTASARGAADGSHGHGAVAVIELEGQLDGVAAGAIDDAYREAVTDAVEAVVLDFADVTYIHLGVAASTLAVAALFLPLRRRVERAVERRFNRSRYDAVRELERFAGRLRADGVDLDSLTDDLLDIVATTVQPTGASVWMR